MILAYIAALLLAIWYINTYVLNGVDKQLIFVRTIALILSIYMLSTVILKFTNPGALNSDNLTEMVGLIKDMTFLIVGYLFGTKQNK
jgi:hypothetical protein